MSKTYLKAKVAWDLSGGRPPPPPPTCSSLAWRVGRGRWQSRTIRCVCRPPPLFSRSTWGQRRSLSSPCFNNPNKLQLFPSASYRRGPWAPPTRSKSVRHTAVTCSGRESRSSQYRVRFLGKWVFNVAANILIILRVDHFKTSLFNPRKPNLLLYFSYCGGSPPIIMTNV